MVSSQKKGLNNLEAMTKLGPHFRPGDFDVFCARGKGAKNHPGNRRFRLKMKESTQAYATATSPLHKSKVVTSVVNWVREHASRPQNNNDGGSNGGGFL